jgi:hypothetical protein
MTRQKKIILILCIASVILVWRVSAVMTKYFPASAAAQPGAEQVIAAPVVAPSIDVHEKGIDFKAQQLVEAQPWGRDPFELGAAFQKKPKREAPKLAAPKVKPPPPQAELKLIGVSLSDGKWLAAVNGRIVRVGDMMEERFKVIEITNSSMTLECEGWAFVYQLGGQDPVIRPLGERP